MKYFRSGVDYMVPYKNGKLIALRIYNTSDMLIEVNKRIQQRSKDGTD